MSAFRVNTAMLMGILMVFGDPHAEQRRGAPRKRHKNTLPWDNIHLSKVERRGKSYEEIQKIRIEKWERQSIRGGGDEIHI